MSEIAYYTMIGLILAGLLMFFAPFRSFVLGLVGAKSVWGLLWSIFAIVVRSHVTVIKNFMPRLYVLPTLDDRRTTNAED